jgi:hypothetical protein
MKLKSKQVEIPLKHLREAQPARIINDAALATVGVGDGRLIPLVIIDSVERPDIEELVRVHEILSPGDVKVQWGELKSSPSSIALLLTFTRPAEALLVLNFDIVKQGLVVDQILSSRALYIQTGCKGDRLSNTLDAKRILIEVPDTGFSKTWDEIIFKHLMNDFRQKGLPKPQAKNAAKGAIEEWRKVGRLRPWAS